MLNSKLKRISLALVLAVVLTLSLFTLSAFALEDAGAAPDGEQGIVLDVSAPAESDTAAADAEKAETPESDSETAVDTTGEAEDEHAGHDHDHDRCHKDCDLVTVLEKAHSDPDGPSLVADPNAFPYVHLRLA